MINSILHKLNPLHIYCRMCDINISTPKANRKLCLLYEKIIFKILLKILRKESIYVRRYN